MSVFQGRVQTEFVMVSRGFWRSACGRFDILESTSHDVTLRVCRRHRILGVAEATPRRFFFAYDFDTGTRRSFGKLKNALAWAMDRAGKVPSEFPTVDRPVGGIAPTVS